METWQIVAALLIVYVPTIILWLYCLTKIVKAKRGMGWKVAWTVAILVLPLVGAIFFLLFGHRSSAYEVTTGMGGPETRGELNDAEVLQELEALRAAGKISPEDYEAIKARHAGGSPSSPPA
jgi:Phospholipase_D-nuclease N-terminal